MLEGVYTLVGTFRWWEALHAGNPPKAAGVFSRDPPLALQNPLQLVNSASRATSVAKASVHLLFAVLLRRLAVDNRSTSSWGFVLPCDMHVFSCVFAGGG